MYGINTEYQIPYIDCLFLCISSMTVNGLATVDLSTLSVMQQVIMFWQMLIGSLVRQSYSVKVWLMTDLRINRHDCCATILLPTQIQTCNPGAATAVVTSEDNVEGRYYPYSTP
jgi:hypothetical protein